MARRKDLKLILMSATLNSDAFAAYFGGCPVVSIPGRTHPGEFGDCHCYFTTLQPSYLSTAEKKNTLKRELVDCDLMAIF